jgi:hypothetical protein
MAVRAARITGAYPPWCRADRARAAIGRPWMGSDGYFWRASGQEDMPRSKRILFIVLFSLAAGPLVVAAVDERSELATFAFVLFLAVATGVTAAAIGWLFTCRLGMREGFWRLAIVSGGVAAAVGVILSNIFFVRDPYGEFEFDLGRLIFGVWGAISGAILGFFLVWLFQWVLEGFRKG